MKFYDDTDLLDRIDHLAIAVATLQGNVTQLKKLVGEQTELTVALGELVKQLHQR